MVAVLLQFGVSLPALGDVVVIPQNPLDIGVVHEIDPGEFNPPVASILAAITEFRRSGCARFIEGGKESESGIKIIGMSGFLRAFADKLFRLPAEIPFDVRAFVAGESV